MRAGFVIKRRRDTDRLHTGTPTGTPTPTPVIEKYRRPSLRGKFIIKFFKKMEWGLKTPLPEVKHRRSCWVYDEEPRPHNNARQTLYRKPLKTTWTTPYLTILTHHRLYRDYRRYGENDGEIETLEYSHSSFKKFTILFLSCGRWDGRVRLIFLLTQSLIRLSPCMTLDESEADGAMEDVAKRENEIRSRAVGRVWTPNRGGIRTRLYT
jgi:hypothetical protein